MYSALYSAVKKSHDVHGKVFYAHDIEHVERVAMLCMKIAPSEEVGHLAAIAALCHNADRILQKIDGAGPFGKIAEDRIVHMVNGWLDALPEETLPAGEKERVVHAVLEHSALHAHGDDEVVTTLRDADRLDILSAINICRHGQFIADLMPAIADNDARDRKGAIPSGINRWLEWADWNEPRFCIRTEKAKPIAEKRAVWLRSYLQAVADDLAETF